MAPCGSSCKKAFGYLGGSACIVDMPPDTARLGYRGAVLRSPSGSEWTAFGGSVSLRSNNVISKRDDQAGRFEKTLLSSAPKGALPDGKIALK